MRFLLMSCLGLQHDNILASVTILHLSPLLLVQVPVVFEQHCLAGHHICTQAQQRDAIIWVVSSVVDIPITLQDILATSLAHKLPVGGVQEEVGYLIYFPLVYQSNLTFKPSPIFFSHN